MTKVNELIIDGCSIYIEQLEQVDSYENVHDNGYVSNKAIKWTKNSIEKAIKPAVSICNSLREVASNASLDEIEFSMQFEVVLCGEFPVLKIVSAESKAQMAIKMKWKNQFNSII